MRTQQPTSPPPPSRSAPRRPLLVALALALALLLTGSLGAFLATRGSDDTSARSAPPPTGAPITTAPTTSLDERAEVVARLREILKIRDEAYRTRNPDLLQSIYTSDCPCLKGDRDLIKELLKKELVWTPSETTIQVKSIERANEQLWVITAILIAGPFQVQRESGQTIRAVPQQSDLSRYVLARPASTEPLLLGRVSFIRRVK